MRRVFLDTNILLDFALEREHAEEAEKNTSIGVFPAYLYTPCPSNKSAGIFVSICSFSSSNSFSLRLGSTFW